MDHVLASTKAALEALDGVSISDDHIVALAGAKYVAGAIKNVDWNPDDHPRDPKTGQFMKTLGGFIFGKAKKATVGLGTTEGTLHLDLKPGDVAFKTDGGNVIVSHADGSWELHQRTFDFHKNKWHFKKPHTVPNTAQFANAASKGKYVKIAENPGVKVEAKTTEDASQMLEHPEQFKGAAAATPDAPIEAEDTGLKSIPTPPSLKAGKQHFTAKQYAEYQQEAKGALLATGADGKPIFSGSWVEGPDGKPYLVHASPYGGNKVSAYRWVSTKQQASNLVKEDAFTLDGLGAAKTIEDPTGKPYGVVADDVVPEVTPQAVGHGSLMSQAVVGAIPNTATAHKKHVKEQYGSLLTNPDGGPLVVIPGADSPAKSGDWVEIDGKPFQMHASPNAGNVALAKWVSTKQQASNNTYDFPVESVAKIAEAISDPTGKPYTPLAKAPEGDVSDNEDALTVDEYKESFTEFSDTALEFLAKDGKGASQVAAQLLIEEKAAASDFVLKFVEAGSFEIEDDLSAAQISALPEGTHVVVSMGDLNNVGALANFKKTNGKWELVGGNESHDLGGEFPGNALAATLYAPDSDALSEALAADYWKPVSAIEGGYAKRGDTWYISENSTTPASMGAAEALESVLQAKATMKNVVATSEVGDTLTVTFPSGYEAKYHLDESGWYTSEFPAFSAYDNAAFENAIVSLDTLPIAYSIDKPTPKAKDVAEAVTESAKNVFVHPVSGVSFTLQPGDIVHKHKSTENAWIIERPGSDLPIHFFNQFGKQYKPKESQKNLKTGYAVASDWPGKKDDEYLTPEGDFSKDEINSDEGDIQAKIAAAIPGDSVSFSSGAAYEKNEDGTWTQVGPGPAFPVGTIVSNSVISSAASNDSTEPKFKHGHVAPAVNVPEKDSDTSMKAPWGGDEAKDGPDPSPVPLTPQGAAKKKTGKKGPLPTGSVVVEGMTIKVEPSQWVGSVTYTSPDGETSEIYFAHNGKAGKAAGYNLLEPSKSYSDVFNNALVQSGIASLTPAKAKAALKKKGDLHADNPVTITDFDEILKESGGEVLSDLITDPSLPEALSENDPYKFQPKLINGPALGFGTVNYWGTPHGPFAALGDSNDTTNFYELSLEEKAQVFSAMRKSIADAHLTYKEIAEAAVPTYKAIYTKNAKGAEYLLRAINLLDLLSDSSVPLSILEHEMHEVSKRFAGKSATQVFGKSGTYGYSGLENKFPLDHFTKTLNALYQDRKFKEATSHLDFDPFDASSEEYLSYATSIGAPSTVNALDAPVLKSWALQSLGYPGATEYSKPEIDAALKKIETNNQIAQALASLKANNKIPAGGGTKVSTAVLDYKALKQKYTNPADGSTYEYTGVPGVWSHTNADGWTIQVKDEAVFDAVNDAAQSGDDFEASKALAYASDIGPKNFDLLAKQFGLTGTSKSHIAEFDDDLDALQTMFKSVYPYAVPSDKASILVSWAVAYASGHKVIETISEKAANYNSQTPPLNNALATLLKSNYSDNTPLSKVVHEEISDGFSPTLKHSLADDIYNAYSSEWKSLGAPAASPVGSTVPALKPNGISPEVWDLVTFSTDVSDFSEITGPMVPSTDAELSSALTSSEFSPVSFAQVPKHLLQVLNWAKKNDSGQFEAYLDAVQAHVKAGTYIDDATPVWKTPGGVDVPIPPGASIYFRESSDAYYMYVDGSNHGVLFDLHGSNPLGSSVSGYHMNTVLNHQSTKRVFTMPGVPASLSGAQAAYPDEGISNEAWKALEDVEAGNHSYLLPLDAAVGGVLTKKIKDHLPKDKFPHIHANLLTLPEQVRQALAASLAAGATNIAALVDYKASQQHYLSMPATGLFSKSAPWLPQISRGQVMEADFAAHWPSDAWTALINHLGESDPKKVSEHLQRVLGLIKEEPLTFGHNSTLPNVNDMTLTYAKAKPGGVHSGAVWADQHGNEWLSKAFPNDPNSKYRVDAEVQSNQISSLFGFHAPIAYVADVKKMSNGSTNAGPNTNYAYLQHMKPAKGDFTGITPESATTSQLSQAMQEHVLDWIISNHDTHGGNLMLSPDGKQVFGIDKGQAWKFFPNDKLAVGYFPPGNGAPVWYDKFYYSVQNGSLPKEKVDEVVRSVLRRAMEVSKDKDQEFREHLEAALKNRDFWPSEYPTREKFIDALVERKHNTFDSFYEFYKNLYVGSPYEFDIDPDSLIPPMLDAHTHMSVSEQFSQDVDKAKVHGKAIFFNTDHLDGAHVLMSTAKAKDGSTVLTGSAKVSEAGDKAISEWLKNQTVNNQSGVTVTPSAPVPPPTDSPSFMPNNDVWFSAMVASSKTVSSHNASGDQQYNQTTLSNGLEKYNEMVKVRDAINKNPADSLKVGKIAGTSLPEFDFQTQEQKTSYLALLDTYIGYWQQVEAHKGTANKISPHFQQHKYQPTKAALDWLKAEEAKKSKIPAKPHSPEAAPVGTTVKWTHPANKNQTETYTKISANHWSSADTSGTVLDDDTLSGYMWSILEMQPVEDFDADDNADVTKTVTIGTKKVEVTLKSSAIKNGNFNFDTGELELSGHETSGGATSQSGNMYEIKIGDTVVTYRPWHGMGVNLAQRGFLNIHRPDWSSNDTSSLNEVFDVLRHTGLDLDPATEESMEITYWRSMLLQMKDRNDTGPSTKYGKVISHYEANWDAATSDNEKLKVLREAWALLLGDEGVEKADWSPKFSTTSIFAQHDVDENDFTTGHPYWHRPDVTYTDMKANNVTNATTNLSYGGSVHDALPIALSGSMLSTEERARYYGSLAKSGASSGSDASKGSSNTVFTRPSGSSTDTVVYHPRVYKRTHNYSFGHDGFGDINQKKDSSPWNPAKAFFGTEMMVKDAVSVMDDIILLQFPNEQDRQKAIKAYKDRGILTLHGFPIEKIFVLSTSTNESQNVIKKVWEDLIAEEKKGAQA